MGNYFYSNLFLKKSYFSSYFSNHQQNKRTIMFEELHKKYHISFVILHFGLESRCNLEKLFWSQVYSYRSLNSDSWNLALNVVRKRLLIVRWNPLNLEKKYIRHSNDLILLPLFFVCINFHSTGLLEIPEVYIFTNKFTCLKSLLDKR